MIFKNDDFLTLEEVEIKIKRAKGPIIRENWDAIINIICEISY